MSTVKFRHSVAVVVAGAVAIIGTIPFAAARWYLAPVLMIPLVVTAWGARAGTDVGPHGVAVRALFGRRTLAWTSITGFVPVGRRVVATLDSGQSMELPAVRPADLPTLIAAGDADHGTDSRPSGTPTAADS